MSDCVIYFSYMFHFSFPKKYQLNQMKSLVIFMIFHHQLEFFSFLYFLSFALSATVILLHFQLL